MASESTPKISPFCCHLSSKKLLTRSQLPLTDADVLDVSGHCWCAKTAQILGPDREPARPEDCRQDRTCFESPFESLL